LFLREYVYVDVDKVRGLAGQLYDGVPERATNISARQKQLGVDLKFVSAGRSSGEEDSIERSMGDTLFKDLEADLEALGLLTDMSETLKEEDSWTAEELAVFPGQIIRITSPGSLFHPNQMSEALVGMATASHGMAEMGLEKDESNPPQPSKTNKSAAQKNAERVARQEADREPRFPEDFLPAGKVVPLLGIERKQLSGIIKLIRGVFGEGVHLHLRPAGIEGPAISARLEPGRKFLDSSPEVLFSRYGLGEQEWTVVGVIGQLGAKSEESSVTDITNANGSINRAKLVDLVAVFLGQTGGMIDLPQEPGFSVIPLAVYRAVGTGLEPEESS
jgi:hypothetical protein